MTTMPPPPALLRNDRRAIAGHYKLAEGPMAGSFGLDVAIGAPQVDESKMALLIPYADGNRRDGVGDLLEVSGIQLWRHRVNPISLFDHGKQVQLPIGTCEDPDTKAYRNEIDPLAKTAKAWCFFYGGRGVNGVPAAEEYSHALFCEQLFDMAVKRILRGGSIGYQNIKTLPLQADYQTGTPPGQHLLVTLMLEFSLVVLPANGDTVMKGFATPDAYNAWEESVRRNLSRGYLVCGKALSPVLHKSLAAYVPAETKTVSGYEGKSYSIARKLQEAGERLAQSESPAPMPGYGQIFLNSDRVWYVGGDGDEDGFADLVQQTLSGIDGIEEVICEAEGFPPKGEGWQQVYPKQRAWEKSMPAKEVAVPLANIPDTKIPPARFNPGVGAVCSKQKLKRLRTKYMGVDQEQLATDTCACGSDGACACRKKLPMKLTSDWKAISRKSIGQKYYELRRVRRDRDGLQGWIIWNTNTGKPVNDDIYLSEADARGDLEDIIDSERMGGYEDPDPGRGVRRKAFPIKDAKPGDTVVVAEGPKKGTVVVVRGESWNGITVETPSNGTQSVGYNLMVEKKSWQGFSRRQVANAARERSQQIKQSLEEFGFSPGLVERVIGELVSGKYPFEMQWLETPEQEQAIGRIIQGKSIQVKYRNKLVKGVPNVQMKFDTSGMSAEQQNAFIKDMAAAGFGKPKGLGGRWSDGEKTQLASPMKAASFAFDLDPVTANIPDAVGKAVAIAGKHGAKFLGSQKSTQAQGTKAMPQKNTKAAPVAKKKAMPGSDVDAMPAADAVAVATDELAGVEGDVLAAEEKMGAQVLRRLHEIHSALLEEGDEMLELLENEQVRALLESKLQDVADTITECEELFSGEGYGSLNGELEDKSADGVDADEEPTDSDGNLEEALPDDSSPDEEEPAEDAVAGMAMKQLRAKYLKALRKHYGKKQPVTQTKALTEDEAAAIADDIEAQTEGTEKALEPWEKKAVGAAAGYLKGLGELAEPWGDGHRKDAYFHHKTLEPIGSQMEDPTKVDAIGQGVEMATDGGGAVKEMATEPQRRAAMARMRENDELDDYDDDKGLRCKGICPGCGSEPCTCAEAPAAMETKLCGRKAVGAASQFLKELSETQEFNDDFRTKSMGWHKDLAEMAADEAAADAVDSGLPPDGEVEMKEISGEPQRRAAMARMRENDELDDYDDDKGLKAKSLKAAAQQDRQALEEAARKLDRLAQLFG